MDEISHEVHQTPRNTHLANMSKSKHVAVRTDLQGLKTERKGTGPLSSLDFHSEVRESTGSF